MISSTNTPHRKTSAQKALFAALLVAAVACTSQGTTSENTGTMLTGDARKAQILEGRHLVISHDCGGCHGGGSNPRSPNWLSGVRTANDEFKIGPFTTRPKNLTPDNQTGTGRFAERQLFNALRYGLRPEETPDVEITSTVPGQGNFPLHPHYLAIPMPWPSWRHMSDKELWAIAAYLKGGLKPVKNAVKDSEGPPDFWAGYFVPDTIGTYPAAPFPTANEKGN
jgi:mono/diheme cytochrome c family protein